MQKKLKIIVIINNVSITIEKRKIKNIKTKNSQDLSNTPFDVLKDIKS